MSGSNARPGLLERYPFKESLAAGAVAFIAGLASIFALVQVDSDLGGAVDDISANYEELGASSLDVIFWLFFNAQSINIEESRSMDGVEQFSESYNLLSAVETSLPEPLYTVLPLFLMLVAGYLVVYLAGANSEGEGALFGGMTIIGYLPLVGVGLVLSRVSGEAQGATDTIAVEPLAGILIVGLALPAFFGAIGGLVAFKQYGAQGTGSTQQAIPNQAPPATNQPPQNPPQYGQPQRQHPPQQAPPQRNPPPNQQPPRRSQQVPQQPPENPPPSQSPPQQRHQPQQPQSPPPGEQPPQSQDSQWQGPARDENGNKEDTANPHEEGDDTKPR